MDKFVTVYDKNNKVITDYFKKSSRIKERKIKVPDNISKIESVGNDMLKKRKRIIYNVFTDGSCLNNCRKSTKSIGGIGVYWGDNDPRNVSEPFLIKPITNNRAELQAIFIAIQTFSLSNMKKRENNILVIHSDSKYCIECMTNYLESWKKRGWLKSNGKEPLNLDLICSIDSLVSKYYNVFKVEYKHVKAHKKKPVDTSGLKYFYWYGNNKADELARIGGLKNKKKI